MSRSHCRKDLAHPRSAEPFWTPRQIARRWQVSARTVRRLIEAGELRACRMGMQLRVQHGDLLSYERGQTITPEAPKQDRDFGEGDL